MALLTGSPSQIVPIADLQVGSVAGGAAGAAGGELAAKIIADQLYPNRDPSTLTNDEKSNVSALSTLAAGLAGGVAGNSLNAAGTGAVNGKVTVENNFLGATSSDKLDEAIKKIMQGDKSLAAANDLIKH